MSDLQRLREAVEAARNYIILRSRAFAELMLWVPTEIDWESPHVAYATRKRTYVSRLFLNLSLPEQAAVVVHEVMHVIGQHVAGIAKGHFHPLLANIAQDALINEAIAQQSWLQLPSGAIRFHSWVTDRSRPWEQWTWQQVYWWLLRNLPAADPDDPNAIPIDASYFPPDIPRKPSLRGAQPASADLEPDRAGEGETESHTDEVQQRIWQQRLQKAVQGDKPGGLLRSLVPLLPKPKVDWRQTLQRALHVAMQRPQQEDWTRPGRRTLAKVVPYYEPALVPPRRLPVVTVVFDTSGSIDDELLQQFAAEVEALRNRYGAELYLLGCDAAVHGEIHVRNDGIPLSRKLQDNPQLLRGGGGTDFRPALQRAVELRSRLCIYFTDLEGTFGEPPPRSMRVVWVTPSTSLQPPFGDVVRIA